MKRIKFRNRKVFNANRTFVLHYLYGKRTFPLIVRQCRITTKPTKYRPYRLLSILAYTAKMVSYWNKPYRNDI